MRVLFDHGTPAPLRQALPKRTVETAYERGWSTLHNGELLRTAEGAGFEVLVTTDLNLQHQQNLAEGFWLLLNGRELFVPFKQFPWFAG